MTEADAAVSRSPESKGHTSRGTLFISAGMESAGSGWLFNLTNEILQASGETDVRELKREFGLDDVLRWDNCNVRDLDADAWVRLEPVLAAGHSFVVKSHKKPSSLAGELLTDGRLRCTYMHRDPRDVVVSAYQRGQRRRSRNRNDSFARLRSINHAIVWMRFRQLPVYEAWRREPHAMMFRYEDLRASTAAVLGELCDYLGVDVSDSRLAEIAELYSGENAKQRKGAHYRGGGRRRDELTESQLKRCNRVFAGALANMGYTD